MKDPLLVLFEAYPYDPGKILASSCGEAYVAIMLANGQIGVCSTLHHPVETDPMQLTEPDLKHQDHRMLVAAYANAHINYSQEYLGSGDIFDQVDFSQKILTVLIGYFPPLVEKFRQNGLSFLVFDHQNNYPDLSPADHLGEELLRSDCVIITATSMLNSTFTEIISQIKAETEIYILGPSAPLFPSFKQWYNIKNIFGMIFKPYDFEVLEIISKGMGTQSFSKKGKKVSL